MPHLFPISSYCLLMQKPMQLSPATKYHPIWAMKSSWLQIKWWFTTTEFSRNRRTKKKHNHLSRDTEHCRVAQLEALFSQIWGLKKECKVWIRVTFILILFRITLFSSFWTKVRKVKREKLVWFGLRHISYSFFYCITVSFLFFAS